MEQGEHEPAPYPSEIEHLEAELAAIMRRLMEISPDAVLRIEKIFHKARIERIVEHSLH